MDKQLERYRSLLKKRTGVCIGVGVFAAALSIMTHYKMKGYARVEPFAGWFRAALIVLGAGALLVILNYVKAFDNPGTLKRLYTEENDEAAKRARSLAGLPFTAYFAAAEAMAGIIAAYFSKAAFIALFSAAAVMILASVGVMYVVRNYFPPKG